MALIGMPWERKSSKSYPGFDTNQGKDQCFVSIYNVKVSQVGHGIERITYWAKILEFHELLFSNLLETNISQP